MKANGALRVLVVVAAVAAIVFGVAGSALAAAPPDPSQVGDTSLSSIAINGVPGTVAVVAPGADVTISANWSDSHPDYCPGCIDFVNVGFAGASSAAGCIENYGFTGESGSGTVDLGAAPTTPGTYDIVSEFGFVYYCGQIGWNAADSVTYTVIAQVVVPDDDLALTNVPASISVNATSPAGASVSYTPPAVLDEDSPLPAVSCSPASGSTFAIGITTVTCTASAAGDSNSPVSASFTVTVQGASDQLAALSAAVSGVGPGSSLADKVRQIRADVTAGNSSGACGLLNAFVNEVNAQTGKSISSSQASSLIAAAANIEAVIGC